MSEPQFWSAFCTAWNHWGTGWTWIYFFFGLKESARHIGLIGIFLEVSEVWSTSVTSLWKKCCLENYYLSTFPFEQLVPFFWCYLFIFRGREGVDSVGRLACPKNGPFHSHQGGECFWPIVTSWWGSKLKWSGARMYRPNVSNVIWSNDFQDTKQP